MDYKAKQIMEALKMQPLSDEEKTSRHILGRLYGPIATCKESTRNGRRYNRDLWEKALSDEIFNEKINNKSLFLELGHPTDREETDMSKVCAVIPEIPKIIGDDLYAYVDILDTSNGKLLKILCDYGFTPGISSRGSGDVLDNNEVDPETFFLETWDIVQLPAVKKARLAVCESFDATREKLNKAINESLNSSEGSEKEIMLEALENLNFDIKECSSNVKENNNTEINALTEKNEKEVEEEVEEPDDEETDSVEKNEEAAQEDEEEDEEEEDLIYVAGENDADNKVIYSEPREESNGEMSYATAKEFSEVFKNIDDTTILLIYPIEIGGKEYEVSSIEDISRMVYLDHDEADEYENTVSIRINVKESSGDSADDSAEEEKSSEKPEEEANDVGAEDDENIEEMLSSLKEVVREKNIADKEIKRLKNEKTVSDAEVVKLKEELERYKAAFARTSEIASDTKKMKQEVTELKEQLQTKDKQLEKLKLKVVNSEKLTEGINNSNAKITELRKEVSDVKKNAEITEARLNEELSASNSKVEERTKIAKAYKNKFNQVLNRYVESKASMLGVRTEDITSKLNENFSVDDVDSVCEDLMTSAVNMSRLPFSCERKTQKKLSEQIPARKVAGPEYGYEIDDSLLELAGLKDNNF